LCRFKHLRSEGMAFVLGKTIAYNSTAIAGKIANLSQEG
jgi:hypothetical protein